MRACVFIQANHRQMLGALVSRHSLRRASKHNDSFDVRIMNQADHAFFGAKEGQSYLRGGAEAVWRNDDLQSFTPLRFMPPELMGYAGRAVVIDPDVFAVADVFELLSRDMEDKAVMCRQSVESPNKTKATEGALPSSVMLLDCARLTHWRCENDFNELFAFKRDYADWMGLKLEDRETIGLFEDEWNDFDRLTPETKLLHTTKRRTQPWKTGLPFEFTVPEKANKKKKSPVRRWFIQARRSVFGGGAKKGHYEPHRDPNQERFFFGLLRECIDNGDVSEDLLRREMEKNHIRHDALEVLEKTPPLAA
jgi:hypothetical protein